MSRFALIALVSLFPLPLIALANELANPGFEETAAGKLACWKPHGLGWVPDRDVVHSGRQSIRCQSLQNDRTLGAGQIIRYEKPDKRPIIGGGWSKAEGVGAGGDYCVFLDAQ